ncbi:MAG: dihydroneopterin aldolase [Acidimicrobiales bacterium]
MADLILVSGLRALGTHGVLPEEKDRAQPFQVDLEIEADLAPAGRSDRLVDTIDYSELARFVTSVVEDQSFDLLERLAQVIAETVLAVQAVQAVTVSVTKLRPPLDVDVATVGVRINRSGPLKS